jgi:hypothetical protein
VSKKSQFVCHRIKQDGPEPGEKPAGPIVEWVVSRIRARGAPPLDKVLGPDAVLVPLPRSAPFPPNQKNVLWVPNRIAHALVAEGWGHRVAAMLARATLVQKSAFAESGQRPSPQAHLDSMTITRGLTVPARIVLIDDVVTKGATLLAGASLIRDVFPGIQVDCFALVRTLGLQPEVDRIVDPVVGAITRNPWGGADRKP